MRRIFGSRLVFEDGVHPSEWKQADGSLRVVSIVWIMLCHEAGIHNPYIRRISSTDFSRFPMHSARRAITFNVCGIPSVRVSDLTNGVESKSVSYQMQRLEVLFPSAEKVCFYGGGDYGSVESERKDLVTIRIPSDGFDVGDCLAEWLEYGPIGTIKNPYLCNGGRDQLPGRTPIELSRIGSK